MVKVRIRVRNWWRSLRLEKEEKKRVRKERLEFSEKYEGRIKVMKKDDKEFELGIKKDKLAKILFALDEEQRKAEEKARKRAEKLGLLPEYLEEKKQEAEQEAEEKRFPLLTVEVVSDLEEIVGTVKR